MNCKICRSKTKECFTNTILKHNKVFYFHCPTCGFLQTEEPYWQEEAYSEPVSSLDTGIIQRNIDLTKAASVIIYFLFDKTGSFLDFAGGYGIFTRMMRDIGFDFYWEDKYTQNLFARGFEKKEFSHEFELITAFECFEHFVDPVSELNKILSLSGSIFFSTQLLPEPLPQPENWLYYSAESGQHISFYSYKTLKNVADKYNLTLCSNKKNLHLLTRKKISNKYFLLLLYLSQLRFDIFINNHLQSRTLQDCKFLSKKQYK